MIRPPLQNYHIQEQGHHEETSHLPIAAICTTNFDHKFLTGLVLGVVEPVVRLFLRALIGTDFGANALVASIVAFACGFHEMI